MNTLPTGQGILREDFIMITLRRIAPAPPSDKDALSWVRESLFGRLYLKYLERFRTLRPIVQWLWRKGYPIYAKYSPLRLLRAKVLTLVKLSVQAARSPEGVWRLAKAETVETPHPAVFPAKDQDYLTAPHDRYVFPDIFVTTVRDAVVTGETNLILTGEEALCHDLYDFPRDYTSEELHGRTVINLKTSCVRWLVNDASPESVPVAAAFVDACALNYAHWMTEVLPRICLFCSEDRFRDVPIVVNDGLHQNLMASLFVVTAPGRTIITLPAGRALRVERLFVVSPTGYVPFERRTNKLSGHSHGVFSPHAFRVLRERVKAWMPEAEEGSSSPQNIYLRRNSGIRKVINGSEIERLLAERGFAVVEPEHLTFAQQVKLFANADMVVGGSGAALANLVFCPPDTLIVVLISKFPDIPYWYWQNIACANGNAVSYVLGRIAKDGYSGIHSNYSVDTVDLLSAIETGGSNGKQNPSDSIHRP